MSIGVSSKPRLVRRYTTDRPSAVNTAPAGMSSRPGVLPTAMRATALMPGLIFVSASLMVSFRSKFFDGGQPDEKSTRASIEMSAIVP